MSIYGYLRSLILPLVLIDKNLPKQGTIIDLGCGQGTIAKYLANRKDRKVIGIDSNKNRLPQSTQKNLSFVHGDILYFKFKNPDGIVLSDVLHHNDFKYQSKILKKISKNLKKGGVLIIKEIDTGEILRSIISRLWDFLLYPKDKIYFSNCKDLAEKLTALGFKVAISRPIRLFPGSTTLFIAKK